ncbi:MAG: glycogen debranching N-terminal domain-containing protein, partial [Terriglobales bacterium]
MELEITARELQAVAAAPPQPRLARAGEPRRVNNLTLIDGKTFLATALAGDIAPPSSTDVGLFHHDTRFLSHWELIINDHRTVVLSASSQQNILAQIELTTTNIAVRDNLDLPENTVHIRREQLLAGHFFDRLRFHNFSLQPVTLAVELRFAADFMDVFQVRGMLRTGAGIYFAPVARPDGMIFAYLGKDELFRQTRVRFDPPPRELHPDRALFEVELAPGGQGELAAVVE